MCSITVPSQPMIVGNLTVCLSGIPGALLNVELACLATCGRQKQFSWALLVGISLLILVVSLSAPCSAHLSISSSRYRDLLLGGACASPSSASALLLHQRKLSLEACRSIGLLLERSLVPSLYGSTLERNWLDILLVAFSLVEIIVLWGSDGETGTVLYMPLFRNQ